MLALLATRMDFHYLPSGEAGVYPPRLLPRSINNELILGPGLGEGLANITCEHQARCQGLLCLAAECCGSGRDW